MNVIALFVAMLPVGEAPFWAPSELLDASRYRIVKSDVNERRSRTYDFEVERRDGVRVDIFVAPSSPLLASKPIRMQSVPDVPATLSSGRPLGTQLYVSVDSGQVGIYTYGQWDQLTMHFFSPIVSQGGRRFNRPDDLAGEARWAEAIARKAFAAYASRRLGPADTIAVNGRSVPMRKADKSNAEMVDLEAWASAVGASLTRDPNGDAWTLVRGGVSRLFALGADKVKVGTVWKPMPDAPMLKDGRAFVPRDGLSN